MTIAGISLIDLILVAGLGFLCGAILYYLKNHKSSCSKDCSSCQSACSKRTKDGLPAFVEAYRRDHPKEEGDNHNL